MRKRNILIIAASSVKSSQRVKRQIDWLSSGEYELFVIGYDKPDRSECCIYYELKPVFRQLSTFRKILIGVLMFAGLHKRTFYYIYNIRELSYSLPFKNFDLIIAHDIRPLLIIELLGLRGKVLVDAHEYYYEYSASNLSDWLIKQQEKYLLKNYFEKQK
ncbi:MAG: hypothetical protein NZ522_05010, partial [Chitinophagales bacterium]|nr:hypothetical protein [Chitinophagales bacterium]